MTSVAIVGAGAIGAWLADALSRAGWSVSMVARGVTLAALRERGLVVTSPSGVHRSRPRVGSPQELGVHDYVLLTVKAHALPALAPALGPLIGPSSRVVSGTNGIPWWFFHNFGGALAGQSLKSVDPDASQARLFPAGGALGAVVHASARVTRPGEVEVLAAERVLLGEPDGSLSPSVTALGEALQAGGVRAQLSQHIRLDVWNKLLGNLTLNPISALTRSGSAAILADANVRDLCVRMMQEMQHCGRQLGLHSDMTPAQRIEVASRLGDFKTSMLMDLEAGRSLEYGPQIGAVAEIAECIGVPVPRIRCVLGLIGLLSEQGATT